MQVIQIKDVCKAFDQRQVLNNISLSVEEGEIFGLLGPSGAGKTTLIKMLIGLLSATSGNIAILGKELDKKIDESFPSFGMVLDNDGLYDRLNCYDNLELYARIYSISNRKKVINDLLEKVGLIESSKKSVSNLSKGMRQRLSFARAILHSPKIVFLDEPTSGLDPATTLQIHSMMKMLKESGTTIFLTTHNMNEAQKMCDHLALLNEGNIVEEMQKAGPRPTISNITIDGNNYVAMFGYNEGIIRGLNIKNINVTGNQYVAGLVASNKGIVSMINLEGNISGTYAGGIVSQGNYSSATVKDVIMNGTVTGTGSSGIAYNSTKIYGIVESGEYFNSLSNSGSSVKIGYIDGKVTAKSYSNVQKMSETSYNDLNAYGKYIKVTISNVDDSGYYFDYNSDSTDIIVKKVNS